MQDIIDKLYQEFASSAAAKMNQLARELIEAGGHPSDIRIGYRTWFDPDTHTMKFECFPLSHIFTSAPNNPCNFNVSD